MAETDERQAGEPRPEGATLPKKPYVRPTLERLGTIDEIVVLGAGSEKIMDGGHPPGHNKSIL